MNRNDIFEMAHSNNTLQLTPLKDLDNEEFKRLILSYDLDVNKFYKVEGKLYPYCYIDNTVLVEIQDTSKAFFDMFEVKERILAIINAHKDCIKRKDYKRLFILIDKPFRFKWYNKLFNEIPSNQKYDIFNMIYTSSEYGFNTLSEGFIEEIFKNHKIDETIFEDNIITIYRGEASKSTSYNQAYSWTTDIKVAKFFANRFNSGGIVYEGKVHTKDILDYIEDRNESEVLVLPKNIFDIKRMC